MANVPKKLVPTLSHHSQIHPKGPFQGHYILSKDCQFLAFDFSFHFQTRPEVEVEKENGERRVMVLGRDHTYPVPEGEGGKGIDKNTV